MEKVVKKPLKIDFHIHSVFSKFKDELSLVGNNTIENLNVLLTKINEYNINMCAITDHDFFSYEMYAALKQHENEGSLIKVFPGVEFSVGMKSDKGSIEQVHVICIFDDADNEKVKRISSCIPFKNGTIDYGNEKAKFFLEEKFISILKEIDLNVITIAHQKGSVGSSQAKKCDVSYLGSVKFNELISCEYFESLEFKNMRNGMFNKNFARQRNEKYDQVRFITGSDCHDWSIYPKHDKKELDNIGYQHTYLKCLPTFRGLSMAFSDYNRISTKDYLFEPRVKKLDELSITIDGINCEIALSEGINVIIGDNSIGKSLLLHKLTQYKYLKVGNKVKDGYEAYLEKHNIEINTKIEQSEIHTFDYQGGVRDKFETDNQDSSIFLSNKFPADLDKEYYKSIISNQFEMFYDAIENKFAYDNKKKELNSLIMIDEEINLENISCKKITNKDTEIKKNEKLINYYTKIKTTIEKNYKLVTDPNEKKIIVEFVKNIKQFKVKYET